MEGSSGTKTVFVAMSGGVDSSVAALLLKRRGYHVVGVFMRCYNLDGCAERDAEDARRVAARLGIPFYVWDFEEEYKRRVVDYMIDGYRRGLTPNPDVMCNREIKFGLFLKKALAMGADYVATGHYVRLRGLVLKPEGYPFSEDRSHLGTVRSRMRAARRRGQNEAEPLGEASIRIKRISLGLFAARDTNKDQSYFLWTLTQSDLTHCLFPIGDYLKPQVRAIARRACLPTAEKKDSQGICFLGQVSVEDFLKQYLPEKRGAILTTVGAKIGEHAGAHFYTIGQRHGLNLSGKHAGLGVRGAAATAPHYVAAKDVRTNTLVVAEADDREALCKKEAMIVEVNIIDPILRRWAARPGFLEQVSARVRYRQPLAPAMLEGASGRGCAGGSLRLRFDEPQRFVAPGQSAVFYGKNGEMLGGGVIMSVR